MRREGPFVRGCYDLEHGAYHLFVNAGKESLALDVTSMIGQRVFLDLLQTAACVVVARPLPVGVSRMLACNPRIAVVELEEAGNEFIAYAASGLMALTGYPTDRPVLLGGHAALSAVGTYVAVAASAALFAARRSGRGQQIVISAAHCLEALTEQSVQIYHASGKVTKRRGYRGAVTAVSGAFECADGYWMISVPPVGGWKRLMAWMEDPVLADDESLLREDGRMAKRDLILDRIEQWSRRHTKRQLVEEAQQRNIPAAPVSTTKDLAEDPQLHARSFFRDVAHRDLGTISFPVGAIAARHNWSPRPAPLLGEHTQAILEELGYPDAIRRALVERGVIS